jgi:hypothetical protein
VPVVLPFDEYAQQKNKWVAKQKKLMGKKDVEKKEEDAGMRNLFFFLI